MKINEIPPFEFKSFSRKQLKMLTWWQDNSPVSDRFMIVADGSIRSGKAQYIGQHVYTPDGYKLMGDIKVGDYVVDRLGNPTKVLGVYPQGEKECYRITFHDGSSTICSNEHLFSYTTKKCAQNGNLTVYTSTLEEIMKDLDRFKNRKTVHERSGKYLFPLAKCVKFNSREVKIDPYLLGLLLGDGCFSEKTSRITFTNAEDELHDYIRNILQKYSMSYVYIPKNDNHCAYGRLQNKVGVHGKLLLRELLEEYGLYGKKSAEKFIPDDYKYNSEEVRLNILAGILNTGGSVHVKNRPSISFYSNSKQLVDDVAEIARSLGLFCNTDIAVDAHKGNPNYSCTIRVKEKLYNLLSEKHRARLSMDSTKDKKWRLIKSIEYVGKKECQCIYVDNPEHLYLTDDFIVTHNTIACITSFILYVMTNYNYMNAAVSGKTVLSLRRNIVQPLKQIAKTLNMEIIDHRSENYLEVIKGDVSNYLYLFGGKDEASQDLVQGLTLCSCFLDEVALMPESFYNQITARLSVEGAKVWTTSNPSNPQHWFYKNVICKLEDMNGLYVHFTMDDNPSLSDDVKERYKSMYSGVWAKRFIEGLVTLALVKYV